MFDVKRKYSEDEVLIFGGQFADKFTDAYFSELKYHGLAIVRNAVADRVEKVIANYSDHADVPLPTKLREEMFEAALSEADRSLSTLLGDLIADDTGQPKIFDPVVQASVISGCSSGMG